MKHNSLWSTKLVVKIIHVKTNCESTLVISKIKYNNKNGVIKVKVSHVLSAIESELRFTKCYITIHCVYLSIFMQVKCNSMNKINFRHTYLTACNNIIFIIILKVYDYERNVYSCTKVELVQTLTSWECRLASAWTPPRLLSLVSAARSGRSSSTYSNIPLNFLMFSTATENRFILFFITCNLKSNKYYTQLYFNNYIHI